MKVYLKPRVLKHLAKIPHSFRKLIEKRVESLEKNTCPSGSKKLQGRSGWRIRVGDYRILYSVDPKKKEIIILSVAHRKEVYKY